MLSYSQDFTDSSWVKANTATLALDSVGPDGQANSAVKLIDSNDSGTGSVIAYTNLTLATTTAHTFSCYLKADQLSWGYLRAASYATLPNGGAFFDLSSGTVGTVEDAAYSATIQDVGNGWYRCALSFTTEADGTGRLDIFVAQDDLDPNVARDGTSSILIYGAQVEAGSTPSSLIPTNSATVSRALETLTIPAANMPWPEPKTITGNLYSGADPITINGDHTFTPTIADDSTTKVVRVKWTQTINTGTRTRMRYRNATNSADVQAMTYYNGNGTFEAIIVTSAGLMWRQVETGINVNISDITFEQIDPLAVSIQMQGRMTYADTDNTTEVALLRWGGVGNWIRWELQTLGTNTGRLVFQQAKDAVYETLTTDAYFPGVLVPYNIASRHGSTFINGAVGGVALTADTTPTGLVDLSATDFNLGYDYMGTISMLRVWADDLADAGIVEATEPSEVPSLQLTFDNSETSFTIQDWEQ